MEVNIDFGKVFFGCFFQLRFRIVFKSFLAGSHLEKSIKTIGFSMVFAHFIKIDLFKKSHKNGSILASFGEAKTIKNR